MSHCLPSWRESAYHFVNCLDNCQHFVVANLTIPVNIIQLEGPVQLVFHFPSAGDAQGAYEFLKIDGPALVGVENLEHIVGERIRIAKGEELSVNLLKLFLGQSARGAVLQETCRWEYVQSHMVCEERYGRASH